MSRGATFSAVFNGSGFYNLCPGSAATFGTNTGTPARKIDGVLGNCKDVGTSYATTFTSYSPASAEPVTMAAIVRTGSADNAGIFCNNGTAGNGNSLAIFTGPVLYLSMPGTDDSSGITLSINTPYFVAATFDGVSTHNVYFIAVNLSTGAVSTATVSSGAIPANTGSGYFVGGEKKYATFFAGRIAAVYYSKQSFSAADLAAWGNDPWSFWYPPTPIWDGVVMSSGSVAAPGPPIGHILEVRQSIIRASTW